MRIVAGWAVLGVLIVGVLAAAGRDVELLPAAPPAAAPSVADVPADPVTDALIADLGSADYKAREKAGKALAVQGEKALPALRHALTTTENPEVARRVSALVRKMDHERLVAPKRVTLSMKDKPAKTIFDEIARQTGYKIDFQVGGRNGDEREAKHTFAFDDTPFWVAVDTVAEAAGVGVYTDYDSDAVQINSYSETHNPHVAYAGPFRLLATGIGSNKNRQLSGLNRRGFTPHAPENINLSFQVQSEPKNPILGASPAELLVATDETGSSLVPPKTDNNNGYSSRSGYYNSGSRGHNATGNVQLVRAGKDATTVKSLKGKIGIVLLAGTSPEVTILDPVKASKKKLLGRSVEVDYDSTTEVAGQAGQYSISLTIKRLGGSDDPNQVDYNWSNTVWQKLELVDAKGGRYRSYGPNSSNNNGNSVQMTIQFAPDNRRGVPQKLGPPVKLVFNEWHQVTQEVTFEFKDVPLP